MTDIAVAEPETDDTMPPAPEAVAAPEAAPAPEVEAETDDTRSAREKVLDHFADSEGDQSVAQIIAGTGLNRNSCEQAIFRAVQSEQLVRVAQGTYRLAPPKPLAPSRNGHTNEEWIARIEAWQANPASWNVERDGPPPNDPNHRIPLDVVGRFKDRQAREAKEREKREAAAAKQEAADAALRDQLLAATGGNFTPGPGLDDLAPIKMALELIPLDSILSSIRMKTDRRIYPPNEPATSWRERRLLQKIAEDYCQFVVVPVMVKAWSEAGKGPATKTQSSPPAGYMTDDNIEIDRSHHDSEHAPPGPHSLPKPPMDEDADAAR